MGIVSSIKLFDQDKANHFMYGSFIYTSMYVISLTVLELVDRFIKDIPGGTTELVISNVIALAIVTLIAFSKEKYSENTGEGVKDWNDMWYTIYGALPPLTSTISTVLVSLFI